MNSLVERYKLFSQTQSDNKQIPLSSFGILDLDLHYFHRPERYAFLALSFLPIRDWKLKTAILLVVVCTNFHVSRNIICFLL